MDDKVKELLDRIWDTAAGAADAANQTARAAGKRAGQMVDVAKLNVQLFDLNGEFNDILRQMGQVMYDALTCISGHLERLAAPRKSQNGETDL